MSHKFINHSYARILHMGLLLGAKDTSQQNSIAIKKSSSKLRHGCKLIHWKSEGVFYLSKLLWQQRKTSSDKHIIIFFFFFLYIVRFIVAIKLNNFEFKLLPFLLDDILGLGGRRRSRDLTCIMLV